MGKKTNSTDTIIKAATSVFADTGYSGARVDEIAKRAGVNKATIYYNIGNKEVLYSKVLQSIFGKTLASVEEMIDAAESPEKKLKIYIRNIAKTIDLNPGFPNILMWEHAAGGKNLPSDIILIIGRMLNKLTTILKEGEQKGLFSKQTPILIQFMIISTMTFYKTSEPIRKRHRELPDSVRNHPEDLSGSIVAELETLILNAVRK